MRKSLPPTPVPTTAEASPARSVDQVVAEGGAVAAASVAQVSGQGPFQLQLFACGVLSTSVMLAHSLAYRLLARPARHWCAPPEGDLTLLEPHVWRNAAIPVLADGSLSRCTVYEPPVPVSEVPRAASRCQLGSVCYITAASGKYAPELLTGGRCN
ncbi:hypothetical protein HPB48_006258 [Haemaphysalis longicornis]|uniref:Uncharacterized protein n=1 Tax=Haemaphysalis longicornis TaxID=44386 RepID=A0A9J6GRY7_HAELO|nr:hypothetical protein HPB48_006258 [Haemaphysalis longicornis]